MNKNKIFDKESVKYGLPSDVKFCKKCVLSNQKPIPAPEFKFHKSTMSILQNILKEFKLVIRIFGEYVKQSIWIPHNAFVLIHSFTVLEIMTGILLLLL